MNPSYQISQSRVSAVNEMMIRKCFAKWEPVVEVVIPASRFNGVSPGPRQLPRCWGFVHFPPTAEGERTAADATKSLNGTTISELRVGSAGCARDRRFMLRVYVPSGVFGLDLGSIKALAVAAAVCLCDCVILRSTVLA